MSEKTIFEHKETGFRFHVSIDKELHVESGTRTPDKVTVHGSLEGHTDDLANAVADLIVAKKHLIEATKSLEPEKQAQEKPAAE